ncbi:DUF938 domain-containing protein [Bosea sp. RAF48]|uniref:DUF938 domain-containing protein n=1 Tax=Bosea sp. RAF48 TaxID=3237480 RepID=UPI003F925A49
MTKSRFWQPTQGEHAGIDRRLQAPAAERNRDAILDVLRHVLPPSGLVLEIASGSGEHAIHFAAALPALTFQPSDPAPDALASIAAWTQASGLTNILPPLMLDACAPQWPVEAADAILCINMIHISPWRATEGLFRQARLLLKPDGPLYLYGPYRRPGRPLEPSNAAFDESLRGRDPEWGLRDLGEITTLAAANGFGTPQVIEMPANNLSVIFRAG